MMLDDSDEEDLSKQSIAGNIFVDTPKKILDFSRDNFDLLHYLVKYKQT